MLDRLISANQKELEELIDKFDKRLEPIFKKINTLATAKVLETKINDVVNFELIWADILKQSGYNELLQRYVNSLDSINGSLNKILDEAGLLKTLSSEQISALTAVKQIQVKDLSKIGMDAGIALKKSLYNNILAGKTKADLLEAMKQELTFSKYEAYAKTYANTGINDYRQAILNQRVKDFESDDDVVYIYQGNDVDSVTRDFCKNILRANRAYSKSEKDRLENDQRRKWNCRHLFVPIYKDDAIEQGYNV